MELLSAYDALDSLVDNSTTYLLRKCLGPLGLKFEFLVSVGEMLCRSRLDLDVQFVLDKFCQTHYPGT